jgi:hypothetical protein
VEALMVTVRIITGWAGDGQALATAYRPAVVNDHALASWTDTSGASPGQGGTFTVLAQVTDAQLAALQADLRYPVTVVAGGAIQPGG